MRQPYIAGNWKMYKTVSEATALAGALVKALRHLGSVNLAEDRPSTLADIFLHTHPSLGARIDAAQRLAREELGEARAARVRDAVFRRLQR